MFSPKIPSSNNRPSSSLLGWVGRRSIAGGEVVGPEGATLGRENHGEVVLRGILERALQRLNPGLPEDAIGQAVEELTRDPGRAGPGRRQPRDLRPAQGWRQGQRSGRRRLAQRDGRDGKGHRLARTGQQRFPAGFPDNDQRRVLRTPPGPDRLRQWPAARPDRAQAQRCPGFRTPTATTCATTKPPSPSLFWYNALIILSNGRESRVGTITSEWEHFSEWKRVASRGRGGGTLQRDNVRWNLPAGPATRSGSRISPYSSNGRARSRSWPRTTSTSASTPPSTDYKQAV